MKINPFSLLFLALLICSCETKDQDTSAEPPQELAKMERLAQSKIAIGDGTTFKLAVTEASLLNVSSKFISSSNNDDLVSYRYKIETINSKRFLRLYREDGLITTVAIEYNAEKGAYYTGNTVCTSSSKSNGCIPDGLYCTKVQEEPSNSNCSRTSFAFYDEEMTVND